jgi:hypothetical protein
MTVTTILTILFSGASALFWFASACTRVPRNVWFQASGGGGAPNEEFENLLNGLRKQTRLNAWAAAFATASFVTQAWVTLSAT